MKKTILFVASAYLFAFEGSITRAEDRWIAGIVESIDGTLVPFRLAKPEGSGYFPLVLFLHGAPGGVGDEGLRNISPASRWERLLKAGFAVCLGDYRGHPEGRPFEALRGKVNASDDVKAIVDYLGSDEELNLDQLILMGNSLGGATALQSVSTGKLSPDCLILNAPASFIFLGMRGRVEHDGELSDSDFDKTGLLGRLEPLKCPVLIIQGMDDRLGRYNQALYRVMKEAGVDVRLELFENEGHGFANGPETPSYFRAIDSSVDFALSVLSREE